LVGVLVNDTAAAKIKPLPLVAGCLRRRDRHPTRQLLLPNNLQRCGPWAAPAWPAC
jgi:hypothetical protein